ncbi:RteC protein [Kaistella haifensis]|nr:RteC protein [Kaistella haifensis]
MNVKLFFRKAEKMYRELLAAIESIEASPQENTLKIYEKILMETDRSIRSLKVLLNGVNFTSLAEEVYFFKELKPLFVSQFIYYSRLLSLEAAKPNAGPHILKGYYDYELQHMQLFLEEYREFYEYYRRKATYLDQKYFVRKQFDFTMGVDPNMYHFDEQFTTSHDHLVARILANDRLEKYLLQSIYHIEGYFYEKFSDKSPLTWSGSKSGLIELLYALHVMRCFNGGTGDFSEVVKFVAKSFNMDPGNIYKTLHEIKNRKTGRTKFLNTLAESLEQHFENTFD